MDEEQPNRTHSQSIRRQSSEIASLLLENRSEGERPAFEVGVNLEAAAEAEEDDDDGLSFDTSRSGDVGLSSLFEFFHSTIIPDRTIYLCGNLLIDSVAAVKLIKFILMTFALIFLCHALVPLYTDDRDRNLEAWMILVYEGNLITSDAVIFFVVGRLWKRRGIDHLAWIGTVLLAQAYFASQAYLPFLQHSATLYEIHCVWPWKLWVFVSLLIPVVVMVVFLHVQYAFRARIVFLKIAELLICLAFFMAPLVSSPYFHMHHWYAGWLFGMHANFDTWWSRAVMAWSWGTYINGIAVYGRDPVLTCEYAYFLTVDQRCPYATCYLEGLERQANLTAEELANATGVVEEMVKPNWRNCSAHSYHP